MLSPGTIFQIADYPQPVHFIKEKMQCPFMKKKKKKIVTNNLVM